MGFLGGSGFKRFWVKVSQRLKKIGCFDLLMELTFLGTASMIPTAKRNHTALFLQHNGVGVLFDCGEGTQRQFRKAKIKPTKINIICISHWHGDHVLGLPGLLDTLDNLSEGTEIKVFGPKGIKKQFEFMSKAFPSHREMKITVTEVGEGVFYDAKEFSLEAYELDHTIRAMGFRFVEKDRRRIDMKKAKKAGLKEGPLLGKIQRGEDVTVDKKKVKAKDITDLVVGKKFGYIADTLDNKNNLKIAKGCDVLVSESSFASDLEDQARLYKHMTAKQAATIAKKSGVGKLFLIHLSSRYPNPKIVLEDATQVFSSSIVPKDLDSISF